ncbi:hypothetical protein WJX84_009858 [Apatococcus fuscideae]|uniref:Uncharacterized protein n=1 Tax=Apatococcus fuscideae TaxID=2026836 RepID=A0AAW1T1D9_9CHLO
MGSLPAGTLECLALCAGNNSYVWQPFHRVEGSNAYFGISLDEPVRTVRWNQNNKVLASAGDEGRLQLHYAGGNLMGTLPIDPNAPVLAPINSVAFSRGSKLLAAGCDDARIVIWDMKSQHQLHQLQPHKAAVTSLAYDPTDTFLASTRDRSLQVLDRRKGRIVASSLAPSPITCLACKDDGLYVALGTQGGVAQLYDPRKLAHSLLKFSCPGDGPVRDVHWQHTSAGKVGGRKPQPIQADRPTHSLNASTSSSAAGGPAQRSSACIWNLGFQRKLCTGDSSSDSATIQPATATSAGQWKPGHPTRSTPRNPITPGSGKQHGDIFTLFRTSSTTRSGCTPPVPSNRRRQVVQQGLHPLDATATYCRAAASICCSFPDPQTSPVHGELSILAGLTVPMQPPTPRQDGLDGTEPAHHLRAGRLEDSLPSFSFESSAQPTAQLQADLPYLRGEDGEVPYPQTTEQTLAAQLQVQLAVEDGIVGLREDVRSLHLDVLRNAQIQQLEMSSAMEAMQAQQDGLTQQVRQLQEQIQALLKARDAAVWL